MVLTNLLAGMTLDEFRQRYWDHAPALLGHSSIFSGLYSIAEMERSITQRDVRFPLFKMARHGHVLDKGEYTTSRTVGGAPVADVADVPTVYRLWHDGATAILNALHFNEPALVPLARQLEREIGHPIQFNAYLTPANSHGFDTHFDIHDVFIVQVEGEKHWKIWNERNQPLPLEGETFDDAVRPDCEPAIDAVLHAGDVLYIPRGCWHAAETRDCPSLHITIGVSVYRRIDAIQQVLETVVRDLANPGESNTLRSAIAPGPRADGDAGFAAALGDVVSRVRQAWSLAPLEHRFNTTRPPDNLHLLEAGSTMLDEVSADTVLEVLPWVEPAIETCMREVHLYYSGRRLDLPLTVEPVIRDITGRRSFKAADLEGLDGQSALLLVRHLVREGLVRVASD